jgi:two-component system response regulator HydG
VTGTVLLVDDEAPLCEALGDGLARHGFVVTWRTSALDALDVLRDTEVDAVLADLNMRGMNGLELCERIVANRPDVPVVVVTAFGTLDTAVAAIRAGAYDFITKPVKLDVLALALDRAVQHRRLRDEVRRLRRLVVDGPELEEMVGDSPAMRRTLGLVGRVADSEATVLVTGESGTGKEVVARALHRGSRRRDGPFVAVNCAAVPETLLESELFGHVRGAFTDARAPRRGLLLEANGGTLLLDEIGDLPLRLQPKLLRALQERTVRPVGGDQELPFDARIVATTNRDLESAVAEGRFREDLLFRVNVIHVELPPLRARGSDVLVLAQHFLARLAARAGKRVTGLSPAAAERLLAYAWPGNVRELHNSIEHAVALAQFEDVTVDDLPEKVRAYRRAHVLVAGDEPAELVPLEEVERRHILRVMAALGGNKTLAAETLGIGRKTLYRKLEQYGVTQRGAA